MAEQLTIGRKVEFRLGDNPNVHKAKVVGYNPDDERVVYIAPPPPDHNALIIQGTEELPGYYRFVRYAGSDQIRHAEADARKGQIRAYEININYLESQMGIIFERAPLPPTE